MRAFASLSLLLAMSAAAASAQPVLIATAKVDAHGRDLSAATAAPLENGTPGNQLGGLGSGLAWAGGDTFLALPDRGPNAVAYDKSRDNTTSWLPRFQTLRMRLTPSAGAGLPFALTPELTATTLLASSSPLAYGTAPASALNTSSRFYFSGRSDAFADGAGSSEPSSARFDPEGIRASADGKSVYVSDEYGPHLYVFDRATGIRTGVVALPEGLSAAHPAATEDVELDANPRGRMSNKGMEGLALTPDGKTLVGVMQSALQQDGGKSGGFARIVTVDVATGTTHQYAYPLSHIGTEAKPKYSGISEIVAINGHEFLVDERDGTGLGDDKVAPPGTAAVLKRLYRIDLKDAQDVSALEGASALAPQAVTKTLFLDIVDALVSSGVAATAIPAKIEGVAFGPDVDVNGQKQHTLWIASDNDFLADLHVKDAADVPNPNQIYVFAVPDADLPEFQGAGFQVQALH